jgi:hypothetical protein
VEEIGAIGKSPDKEDVHRCLVHRDIGDPGDKCLCILNREPRNPDKEEGATVRPAVSTSERREVPLWEPAVSINRRVGIRGIGNPVGKCFAAFETP